MWTGERIAEEPNELLARGEGGCFNTPCQEYLRLAQADWQLAKYTKSLLLLLLR
jgi:hypothetical protein